MAKTKVSYKTTYNMEIENLDYGDVSYLYEALSGKKDNDGTLEQPPTVFNEIIEVCEHILEKEQ